MFSEEYRNLFRHSRESLEEFEKSGDSGETAIEDSLKGKFFEQIYDLNKYIFTTGSTNYPGEHFQPFFIVFTCPEELGRKIIKKLDPFYYGYTFKQLIYENDKLFTIPLIHHMIKVHDDRLTGSNPLNIDEIFNPNERLRKIFLSETLSTIGIGDFPDESIEEYKSLFINLNMCEMEIEASDINDENLYLDLLDIIRSIL